MECCVTLLCGKLYIYVNTLARVVNAVCAVFYRIDAQQFTFMEHISLKSDTFLYIEM